MSDEPLVDHGFRRPAGRLAPYVTRFVGYRYSGVEPGLHRGMPSCQLTLVISLGPPTCMAAMPDPQQRPAAFVALAGGLHTRPVMIEHDGSGFGVQLELTPAGSRALLGTPASELASAVVDLADVIGPVSGEMVERCREAADWEARFDVVEEVLTRRSDRRGGVGEPLDHAWRRMSDAFAAPRVAEVADEIGWSRRYLGERFVAEFGVTPKQAARLARFQRSHQAMRRTGWGTLAEIAVGSGYYDQAHMAREWNQLAGCPPSEWLATETLVVDVQ